MDLQHVNVKVYVDGELGVEPERFIEVFHRWVREQKLDELLIDVADYRHVPAGPGVMLIGHEADYSMDHADNRWGLRYNRKAPVDGSNQDRLRQALCAAVNACRLLEADEQALKFSRQELEIFINDRVLVPNTPQTFESCKPELGAFLKQVLGDGAFSLEHRSAPRGLFRVAVSVTEPFDLATLLATEP